MKQRILFIFTAIMFSWVVTAQAQESSSKVQKIASCGPNALYKTYLERPEVVPGEGGVHIRDPYFYFDQEGQDQILWGEIYILQFQDWNIRKKFPGGLSEAVAFFRYHCSLRGIPSS